MTLLIDPIYRRDPFGAHCGAVDVLDRVGISPPDEWTALRLRYSAFMELGSPLADRLGAEVITPSGADLPTLRNAAIVDELATAEADLRVNARVQGTVLDRLRELYQPSALPNYKLAAASYDDAARRFTVCAKAIDVEAAAGESLAKANAHQRQAWFDAADVAAELENALRVLCAAAALAGAPPDVAFLNHATDVQTTEYQISLATDPGRAHRRQTWLAWTKTDGRTGRWGALTALGVKIHAAERPDRVKPYKRPAAPVAVMDPNNVLRQWDPHDGKPPNGWKVAMDGWQGSEGEWGDD